MEIVICSAWTMPVCTCKGREIVKLRWKSILISFMNLLSAMNRFVVKMILSVRNWMRLTIGLSINQFIYGSLTRKLTFLNLTTGLSDKMRFGYQVYNCKLGSTLMQVIDSEKINSKNMITGYQESMKVSLPTTMLQSSALIELLLTLTTPSLPKCTLESRPTPSSINAPSSTSWTG